ncbi:MAG: extracellular solute-binding protein [Alphaproteobacteria bacterium]|nr:extracellular solute-binding protein [Alphaproteobacteria bacterium]
MVSRSKILGALTAGIFATGLAATATDVAAKDIVLNMAGPDWGPTRFLQEKFNKTYKAKSGNNVKLVFDFIPWPSFYDRVAASLTSGEKKYQMVVSDSQWIGTFIEGGHFLKLNKYIDADPELQAIMKDTHPAFVEAYATYPHKSKNYYGFPQFPDTKMTWFRKDLFCHEGERATFKKKYGATLPCSYAEWKDTDWKTWAAVGEFFRRAKGAKLGDGVAENDFYGIAYQAGKGLDFSSMQINAFIWQHGGSIWDEANQPKAQAIGVVNSDASVKGFQHHLDLLKLSPPVTTRMLPPIIVIIPIFLMFRLTGLSGSYIGVILLYAAFNLPFSIWMIKSFFDELSADVEDAARLDGSSERGVFFRICLPQLKAGLAATAVFALILTWNEFLFALLLTGSDTRTVPVAMARTIGGELGVDWGLLAAIITLFLIPVFAVTYLLQNHLLRGVTFGTIKK